MNTGDGVERTDAPEQIEKTKEKTKEKRRNELFFSR